MISRRGGGDLNTDKGEVGGSSPPRPTIQITSKYAVILTFPLFGDLPQQTVLSTVCQLYDWPDGSTLRSVKTLRVNGRTARIDLAMSRMPPCQVEGRATQCKTLQACGRRRHFETVKRGIVQLSSTPHPHLRYLEHSPPYQGRVPCGQSSVLVF